MVQAIGIVSYEDEYYESAEINISKAQKYNAGAIPVH